MKFSWPMIVKDAVSKYDSPMYIFAWKPVLSALQELEVLDCNIPVKHWLSFKSQPVAPLVRNWRDLGYGVEVVSEFEFLAALHEKYSQNNIIINGVAKHDWLYKYDMTDLRVHFDSINELNNLLDSAIKFKWRVGLRCHVSQEYDPDEPSYGGQFGMLPDEAIKAINILRDSGVLLESMHFHLRSNVRLSSSYKSSIEEIKAICDLSGFYPLYLDLGGGFPVAGEYLLYDSNHTELLNLDEMRNIICNLGHIFPMLKEVWFENGRFMTSRSGVLIVKVIDIKERDCCRYLICNGGRTNHALISDWELHDIFLYPERKGTPIDTTVCGSTCMAFDRLLRTRLPNDIKIGDYIIWMNAGAYHVPWETRFSKGLCTVLWCDENNKLIVSRKKEEFIDWWNCWLKD